MKVEPIKMVVRWNDTGWKKKWILCASLFADQKDGYNLGWLMQDIEWFCVPKK